MGFQKISRFTCDGPGCDLTQELVDGDPHSAIHHITIERNGSTLWQGYMCAACEGKQDKAIKELLSGGPGQQATAGESK